jgi:hypothetical protein
MTYFYALKGENCEWKCEVHCSLDILKEKELSIFTSETCCPCFSMLLVLYYISSLFSFCGGMSLAFPVDLTDYLISSSLLCVPGSFA